MTKIHKKEEADKKFERGEFALNAGNGKPPMRKYDTMMIKMHTKNEGTATFYASNGDEIYADAILIKEE